LTRDSDRAWKELGRTRPYSAIVEHESRAEFFESGEQHVELVMQIVRDHIDPDFRPARALDYGCGAGRILIPLARLSDDVVGVDVSEDMLSEARRNCDGRGLGNVELRSTLDELADRPPFDLVHTYIVLQHIPRQRGMEILSRLVGLVAPGGIGVVQVLYAREASPLRKSANWARAHVPGANRIANRLQGLPSSTPLMQMNVYSLDDLARVLHRNGCDNAQLRLGTTRTGGYFSALIVFRKEARAANALD
jgi:2-polyprenyl-3-methyl-5-hydroxy-6-metoxy-1,4-benzoquinol methylase